MTTGDNGKTTKGKAMEHRIFSAMVLPTLASLKTTIDMATAIPSGQMDHVIGGN
jgi:hypothetical protein